MLKYSRSEMIIKLIDIKDEDSMDYSEILTSRIVDILDARIISYDPVNKVLKYRIRNHLGGAIITANIFDLRKKLIRELAWLNWIRIMWRHTYGNSRPDIRKSMI